MEHLHGRSGCFTTAPITVTMARMLICLVMAGPVAVVIWCWRRLGLIQRMGQYLALCHHERQ